LRNYEVTRVEENTLRQVTDARGFGVSASLDIYRVYLTNGFIRNTQKKFPLTLLIELVYRQWKIPDTNE